MALVFVALATGLAFLVQHLISAPNVTLIYVLPVIISATLPPSAGDRHCWLLRWELLLSISFSPNPIIRLR